MTTRREEEEREREREQRERDRDRARREAMVEEKAEEKVDEKVTEAKTKAEEQAKGPKPGDGADPAAREESIARAAKDSEGAVMTLAGEQPTPGHDGPLANQETQNPRPK